MTGIASASPAASGVISAGTTRFAAECTRLWQAGDLPGMKLGLAVSGGPDSLALLLLAHAARPGSIEAATVDHGLRRGSAREARDVKHLATSLGMTHRIVRWGGAKPESGLPGSRDRSRTGEVLLVYCHSDSAGSLASARAGAIGVCGEVLRRPVILGVLVLLSRSFKAESPPIQHRRAYHCVNHNPGGATQAFALRPRE